MDQPALRIAWASQFTAATKATSSTGNSGKLGSINHTLLSFEAIKNRDIALDTVLYNLYPTVEDKTIQEDTMKYIKQYLFKHFPGTKFEVVPEIV